MLCGCFACRSEDRRPLKSDLAVVGGTTRRVDGAPLGTAYVRDRKHGVPVARLRRIGALASLRPRLYLIAEDGSVVGSVIGRRHALSDRDAWEFPRPLDKVSALECGKALLPVDPELMRAMRWSVSLWRAVR